MVIVYSYYVLDLVHAGHLLMMHNGKALAGPSGKFVAGILTDKAVMEKKPAPVVPFEERIQLAKAIRFVDLAIPQETYSPIANVRQLRPDILLESTSHAEQEIQAAREVMEEIGGKVIVLPYFPSVSSGAIKKIIRGE